MHNLLCSLDIPMNASGVINRKVGVECHALKFYPTVYVFMRAAKELNYVPRYDRRHFLQCKSFIALYKLIVDPCVRCERTHARETISPRSYQHSLRWHTNSGRSTIHHTRRVRASMRNTVWRPLDDRTKRSDTTPQRADEVKYGVADPQTTYNLTLMPPMAP